MTTVVETQPTAACTCYKFIRLHDGHCEVHGFVRKSSADTETGPAITLSNFRVEYHAPRYEDGKVLYDGYCAILADDAALDGAEVRVFDVPDIDEGQLAAALFACEAMNRYHAMYSLLQRIADEPCDHGPASFCPRQEAQEIIGTIMSTTTSK